MTEPFVVLIITANPETRSLARLVIEEEGHRIIETEECTKACSLLSERLLPDLLLIEPDCTKTSEMLGIRMLMTKIAKDRICLVLRMGDNKLRQEARELGITRFLTRPVTRRDLESLIGSLGQGIEGDATALSGEGTPWWALYTRYQCEKMVAENLSTKQFNVFLPLYKSVRRWTDRQKTISLPIFPGYLFVRGGLDRRLEIVTTPGVQSILFYGEQVATIPEDEIHAIKKMVEGPYRVEPYPFLKCGEKVRITRGSLKGIEGVLVRKKNIYRIVLSMDLLAQSVAVEIDASDVEPLTLKNSISDMQAVLPLA